jgi:hypothetical protein
MTPATCSDLREYEKLIGNKGTYLEYQAHLQKVAWIILCQFDVDDDAIQEKVWPIIKEPLGLLQIFTADNMRAVKIYLESSRSENYCNGCGSAVASFLSTMAT